MLCHECGAEIKDYFTTCSLCGKVIDREKAFKNFVEKGDEFFRSDEIEKAIIAYNRALDYQKDNEDLYIKLGNAYMKKNDKQAATYYLKALSLNFYNDVTHNYLIAFYSKFNKLEDLKSWYIKNKERFDNEFINKYIKIIDNTILFTTEKKIKIGTEDNGFWCELKKSMRMYLMFNIIFGVVFLLLVVGLLFSYFLKINVSFFLVFAGMFLIMGIFFITFKKMENLKKKKDKHINIEDFLKETKKD